MTITAIVIDASGKRKILLPDYAVADAETEYALSPVGPVVARARKTDIIYVGPSEEPGVGGVVLATLEENATTNNSLAGAVLNTVAPAPPSGAPIKLISSSGEKTGVIRQIDGPFVVTDGRVTEPGDGGAPVVNADGALIAMGYIGTKEESKLLSPEKVFQQNGLKLAQ